MSEAGYIHRLHSGEVLTLNDIEMLSKAFRSLEAEIAKLLEAVHT